MKGFIYEILAVLAVFVIGGFIAIGVFHNRPAPRIEKIQNMRMCVGDATIRYEVVWYDGYWSTSGMASVLVFSNGVGYEQGRTMEYDHKSK